MKDLIDRQAAIDAFDKQNWNLLNIPICKEIRNAAKDTIRALPSAQPEPAIPLSWIEGQIEWLKSLDNAFSTLTAGQILAMMNKWKDEQNERSN